MQKNWLGASPAEKESYLSFISKRAKNETMKIGKNVAGIDCFEVDGMANLYVLEE